VDRVPAAVPEHTGGGRDVSRIIPLAEVLAPVRRLRSATERVMGGDMTARTGRSAAVLTLVAMAALVIGCSSSGTADLTGKTWRLTTITEKNPVFQGVVPADQQASYTILFNDDGTASVKADCNTGSATWKAGSGASLTITLGAMTLAACPPGSLADQFVRDLGKTVSYTVNGSTLKLTQNDAGELELTTG
jgi:heat shock protein HslJ